MNPLFQNASRAIRAALRQEFRSGELGKLLVGLERQRRGRGGAKKYMREVARKLHGPLAGRTLSPLPGWQEHRARYAKKKADETILDTVFKAFGPLGHIIESFLRPTGKSLAPNLEREKQAAAAFLKSFGYEIVSPPKKGGGKKEQVRAATDLLGKLGFDVQPRAGATGPHIPAAGTIHPPGPKPLPGWAQRAHSTQAKPAKPEQEKQPPPRKTIDVDFGDGRTRRIKLNDPILTGEMIPVVSSNVHSIGFEINTHTPRIGTLKIRFLQSHGAKAHGAKVPGATYEYYNVPTDLFRRFRTAASKGKWVWNNVRIRGTGDTRFDYKLAGINYGYVPRRHLWTGQGLTFQKRTFLGQHKSGQVKLFHSKETALVRPWNGRPGGGTPNRGKPNRGR